MFANTGVKGVISTNQNVNDMSGMFRGTTQNELDVSGINTGSVTNMRGMFENSKATSLDLRNFVTTDVTNMENMLRNTNVTTLDLGSFNLDNVTNTNNMFQGTKATTGYARTQSDLNKLNSSTNKPVGLNLNVWGITVNQTPLGWTNDATYLDIESFSGGTTLKDTELVNNVGENILRREHFNPRNYSPYTGARVTRHENITVPEWGVYDAIKFTSIRGTGDHQMHFGVSNTSQWLGQVATHSIYVKNEGIEEVRITYNGLNGANSHTIPPGFSGRVHATGTFRTSHTFIQYMIRSSGNLNVTLWGHKIELGREVTPYAPPLDTDFIAQGIYPIYRNGTYLFRSTDSRGETRTVAHTVNNIDNVRPTAKITKSTEGWTSQDVTLYVEADDDTSGVKSITLPDGRVVNGSTAEFTATENKSYTFKVTDNAGNEETITETITNIDRSIPDIKATVSNRSWTRGDVKVTVVAETSLSGIESLELTSGQDIKEVALEDNTKEYTVTRNGLYTFKATYNNGVTSEATVNITNIDKDAPTVTVKNNPEDWVEDDEIDLEISVSDNNQSGVKKVIMPDGKVITGTTATYKVTENGEYDVIVEDNVGNKRTHTITVNRMMLPYYFYMFDNNNRPLQGAGFELLRDGVVHATSLSDVNGLVDFGKVPTSGVYNIRQVSAPDGYIINPDEREVDLEDTTDPDPFISYPRGKELPATGTKGLMIVGASVVMLAIEITGVTVYKKKRENK